MFIHNKYIVLNIIQPLWLCHQNCVKLLNAIYYGSFFSTEVGERRLHSNPVGTPNLFWIGWKLQKFSLQNFQLIPLSGCPPSTTNKVVVTLLFTEGVIVLRNRTQR